MKLKKYWIQKVTFDFKLCLKWSDITSNSSPKIFLSSPEKITCERSLNTKTITIAKGRYWSSSLDSGLHCLYNFLLICINLQVSPLHAWKKKPQMQQSKTKAITEIRANLTNISIFRGEGRSWSLKCYTGKWCSFVEWILLIYLLRH